MPGGRRRCGDDIKSSGTLKHPQPQVPPQRTTHFSPRRPGPGSCLAALPVCDSGLSGQGAIARQWQGQLRRRSPIIHASAAGPRSTDLLALINNYNEGQQHRGQGSVIQILGCLSVRCPSCFHPFRNQAVSGVSGPPSYIARPLCACSRLPSLCEDRDSFQPLRCPAASRNPTIPPRNPQKRKSFNTVSRCPFLLDIVPVPRVLRRQPSEHIGFLTLSVNSQYSELRLGRALALAALSLIICIVDFASPPRPSQTSRTPASIVHFVVERPIRLPTTVRPGHTTDRLPDPERQHRGALRVDFPGIPPQQSSPPPLCGIIQKRPASLLYIAVDGRSLRVPQQPWALPVPRAAEVCNALNAFLPTRLCICDACSKSNRTRQANPATVCMITSSPTASGKLLPTSSNISKMYAYR